MCRHCCGKKDAVSSELEKDQKDELKTKVSRSCPEMEHRLELGWTLAVGGQEGWEERLGPVEGVSGENASEEGQICKSFTIPGFDEWC